MHLRSKRALPDPCAQRVVEGKKAKPDPIPAAVVIKREEPTCVLTEDSEYSGTSKQQRRYLTTVERQKRHAYYNSLSDGSLVAMFGHDMRYVEKNLCTDDIPASVVKRWLQLLLRVDSAPARETIRNVDGFTALLRRAKNRDSAATSRAIRKAYIADLKARVDAYEKKLGIRKEDVPNGSRCAKCVELGLEVIALINQNSTLRDTVVRLQRQVELTAKIIPPPPDMLDAIAHPSSDHAFNELPDSNNVVELLSDESEAGENHLEELCLGTSSPSAGESAPPSPAY